MPWVIPPTFADGEILTATKLNQLADAVRFLNGVGGVPSVGINSYAEGPAGGPGSHTGYYEVRHRYRYLKVYFWSDGADTFKIYCNDVLALNVTPANGHTTLVVDLNSVAGLSLSNLQFYEVKVYVGIPSGRSIKIKFIQEEPS